MNRQRSKKKYHRQTGRLIFAVLFVLFIFAGLTAAGNLILTQESYKAAQREYAKIRQFVPKNNAVSDLKDDSIAETESVPSAEQETGRKLSSINPDYVGWIRIVDTDIDYPVVQGRDNSEYLDISFSGDMSPSGTIFMDSECAEGFSGPYCILHGHNMKDGSMFAGLNLYLDNGYLAEHPEIMIITQEGVTQIYQIISVKVTNVKDGAYLLLDKGQQAIRQYLNTLNVSENANHILVLSTCRSQGDKDERLLIIAACIESI